uniref:PARP-type domain-containing protein n=1 Tax=Megaselia scalaris TaxID=36166 RepID=T1H0E0_MEGSC
MSDSEKPFAIENAKTGRAACKKCKEKCETGQLRIAKLVANYFSDSGMMKHWFHLDCLFKAFPPPHILERKLLMSSFDPCRLKG